MLSGAKNTTNTTPWDSSSTAPLLRPIFRALWVSMMISTLGIWMHEIGAGWLIFTASALAFFSINGHVQLELWN